MKTIGLLGGMSWESSAQYYRLINELTKQKLGGLHSMKSVMYTVDFDEIERCQREGNWEQATQILIEAAQAIERAGADLLVICTNTMHKMAGEIRASIHIPLLHIADATAAVIQAQGLRKVGLLATAYTMEQDFYKGRLREQGLEVIVPSAPSREIVHRVIYEELCRGIISEESRTHYRDIMRELVELGAEGIILGCTEISLLVRPEDAAVPLFDTTSIHAQQAVELALTKE